MKDKYSPMNRFKFLFLYIPFAMGIIALIFSWQAYRISQETKEVVTNKNQPNIILAYTNGAGLLPYSDDASGGNTVLCAQTFTLQNTGGSPTSLTGYDLVVEDGYGESVHLSSQDGRAEIMANLNLLPGISGYYDYLFPGNFQISEQTFGAPNELELPAQIDSYSAIKIQAGLRFLIGSSLSHTLSTRNATPQSLLIQLIYTFHFASGQKLGTPELTCYYYQNG